MNDNFANFEATLLGGHGMLKRKERLKKAKRIFYENQYTRKNRNNRQEEKNH